MRIYYQLSEYISHHITALEYIACLRMLGHEVITEPERAEEAELAILHDAPSSYAEFFERLPILKSKRLVAFCVWENEMLPEAYARPLKNVHEIWTPSTFSQKSILARFPNVRVLPHVVRRIAPSRDDLDLMHRKLNQKDGELIFFSIIDAINPRKNIQGLLRAFARLRARAGSHVRLVLKQYRFHLDYSSLPGITTIEGNLSDELIAACYILSDAYVSAHHAEGWGLGLSQAMAYGKPVIATAYSGNMEYMNVENSLPVRYTMVPVSEEMTERFPLFSRDMLWAEPDERHFASCMLRIVENKLPATLDANAALVCDRFGRNSICLLLQDYLANPLEPCAQ